MATAKCLALEWDQREVRVLVLGGIGRRIDVQDARAFAFPAEGRPADAQGVGAFLRAALVEAGIPVKSAYVVAEPADVLLRHLKLPPAPDDDLAGMVRLQAAGELTATLEGASLDYAVLPCDRRRETSTLAALLPAGALKRYAAVLESAGLTGRGIVLHGQASAAALEGYLESRPRAGGGSEGAKLLLDTTSDSLCLSVLVEGTCVLAGWRRLPSREKHGVSARFLAGEAARTLTAFHAQFPAWNVAQVYLAGYAAQQPLADGVAEALGREVELFDPLSVHGSGSGDAAVEDHGHFAALAGVAWWLSHGTKPPVDFLHAKEPAKPQRRGRQWAAGIGLAAAVLVAAAALWYGGRHRALAREMASLENEIRQIDDQLEELSDVARDSQAIREWAEHEVLWLDELYAVAQRFPRAEDAYVTKLDLLPHSGRLASRMRLDAQAKSEGIIHEFHREMSKVGDRYVVQPEGVQEQTASRQYPWKFQSIVVVSPSQQDRSAKPRGSPNKESASEQSVDERDSETP